MEYDNKSLIDSFQAYSKYLTRENLIASRNLLRDQGLNGIRFMPQSGYSTFDPSSIDADYRNQSLTFSATIKLVSSILIQFLIIEIETNLKSNIGNKEIGEKRILQHQEFRVKEISSDNSMVLNLPLKLAKQLKKYRIDFAAKILNCDTSELNLLYRVLKTIYDIVDKLPLFKEQDGLLDLDSEPLSTLKSTDKKLYVGGESFMTAYNPKYATWKSTWNKNKSDPWTGLEDFNAAGLSYIFQSLIMHGNCASLGDVSPMGVFG